MDLFRALAALAEPPTAETAALAHAVGLNGAPSLSEYTGFFVFQQLPYASVYLGLEGMVGGEARDCVAGFWRALGAEPPPEPDHLATLLAAYADLAERHEAAHDATGRTQLRAARYALLWEHILSWLPVFLMKARDSAPGPYGSWAGVLMEALLEEARASDVEPVTPIHFRGVPPLERPAAGASDAFLAALLSPVRTGMILTRHDFTRAAQVTALGVPSGERRHMLRALIEQDAEATVRWLSGEAAHWAQRHEQLAEDLGPVAAFWTGQAEATATLLRP